MTVASPCAFCGGHVPLHGAWLILACGHDDRRATVEVCSSRCADGGHEPDTVGSCIDCAMIIATG